MAIEQGSRSGAGSPAASAGMLENKGRDLGRKADEVGDRLVSRVRDKAHDIEDAGHQLQERVVDAKDNLVSSVQGGRDRVTGQLQENPMRTLLLTAGIGVLAGLLLARRMRK